MQVMFNVANPLQREQTMTKSEDRAKVIAIKELPERDEDFVRQGVRSFVQAALEAEMTEARRLRRAIAPKAGLAIAVAITAALGMRVPPLVRRYQACRSEQKFARRSQFRSYTNAKHNRDKLQGAIAFTAQNNISRVRRGRPKKQSQKFCAACRNLLLPLQPATGFGSISVATELAQAQLLRRGLRFYGFPTF
jgi:hypothetical protein